MRFSILFTTTLAPLTGGCGRIPTTVLSRSSMPARRASFKLGAATVAENDAKVAQYLRDAQWFARSFSTAADAKVPDKAETKVHVNKLLRGPSTRLTREIVDDEW